MHFRQAFQDLGRFNITVLSQRIEDLDTAVTDLEEYVIVVVPQLSQYELIRNEDGYSQANITISFTIFRDGMPDAQFFLETIGYNSNAQEAFMQAVDELPAQLEFRLRSLEGFSTDLLIIERYGNKIVLELGSDAGIVPGDEYEASRLMESGQERERIALMRVREVTGESSIAEIIYERKPLHESDQIRKLPRIGVNIMPYLSGLFSLTTNTLASFSVGTKAVLGSGVYVFRPVIAFELVFSQLLLAGLQTELPLISKYRCGIQFFPRAVFHYPPGLFRSNCSVFSGYGFCCDLSSDEFCSRTFLSFAYYPR